VRIICKTRRLVPEELDSCIRVLRQSGILCYPTETFYALGIDPWSEPARDKLYALKEREAGKELPLIAADVAMVERFCLTRNPFFKILSERFWPGPLTLVLPARDSHTTCAMRVSAHPIARQISHAFQSPIVSTSANRSGEPPVQNPQDFSPEFLEGVEIMIDSGVCPGGLPSTIVSLTGNHPRVLREGAISSTEIDSAYEAAKKQD